MKLIDLLLLAAFIAATCGGFLVAAPVGCGVLAGCFGAAWYLLGENA